MVCGAMYGVMVALQCSCSGIYSMPLLQSVSSQPLMWQPPASLLQPSSTEQLLIADNPQQVQGMAPATLLLSRPLADTLAHDTNSGSHAY